MLHLLALLHCSGEFRIWPPTNQVSNAHPALNNNSATQADHKRMLDLLGIKSLRPGREGFNTNSPNYANYNEAKANPFPVLPDPLTLNNGTKVTTAEMWWKLRRPEIVEDFDRDAPVQLMRIALPAGSSIYPEISGSHYRSSIRFVTWNGPADRPRQAEGDVSFEITCCT